MTRLVAELNGQFATLRDTLLPKLLSGKVAISELSFSNPAPTLPS